MKKYSVVSDSSDSMSRKDCESISLASRHSRFTTSKRITNSALSEPLTGDSFDEEGSSDPYFVFRSDLQHQLEVVDEILTEYLRIVHETDTATNSVEYKDSKKRLKRQLKTVESTLKDVHRMVSAVENDREKFPHIDDSQLFERKSLVETSRSRIQHCKNEMNSEKVKKKTLADERQKAIRRSGDGLLGAKNDLERQNTDFILDSQAQSSLLMHEQDECLDELGNAVTRVGEMAEQINEEIGHQNKMLDELDQDMTNAEEELGMVMGKMAKFLGTKNRGQLKVIFTLSLIVVILLFLVIYT
mmetsp:Transcript_5463/g.11269  ORF Transcript_5463/g.11269 Transcript_5463/m.11269 type:complete len:301 (+) Transcript_5463:169-1071(+)|eukprot:CAMPEP_0197272412 /NCGR_PEP_ID=MMETSP1432-20130617/9893_1 /TAXON_ID=44447 /ORGANISM="Pseudo-nitzschia delicatissima, Strain UNC1205" /LENGTH=300 /DNA_ID=CAMNT_0042737961 /DNA_START=163 /DNA_END=1065 /DNA_ORIENTATION=+